METQETMMNENESLQLITEMINSTKRNLKEDSYAFLFFGYLFFLGSLSNLIMNIAGCGNYSGIAWLITLGLGAVIGVFMGFKYRKISANRPKVRTHNDKIMGRLWLSFGVSMGVLMWVVNVYANISKDFNVFAIIMPMIMMLYGIGIYMSGVIIKFTPLMWGGVSCWLFAALSVAVMFSPAISVENFQWICICLALLTGYIIPGHMLRSAKA